MSTFLELCEDVARESGAAGRAPSSVTGQTGRAEKVVEWVRAAWLELQNSKADWFFLRAQWDGEITDGTAAYTDASFSIVRFGEWIGDRPDLRPTTLYDPAIGVSNEAPIRQISYESWRRRYDIGSHDEQRPSEYCFAPDGSICFGPTPDKTYNVRGEYRKSPQVLATNSEEPDMPSRFHRAIVFQAVMMMAEHDEGLFAMQAAQKRLNPILYQMHRDLLPKITMYAAAPLA